MMIAICPQICCMSFGIQTCVYHDTNFRMYQKVVFTHVCCHHLSYNVAFAVYRLAEYLTLIAQSSFHSNSVLPSYYQLSAHFTIFCLALEYSKQMSQENCLLCSTLFQPCSILSGVSLIFLCLKSDRNGPRGSSNLMDSLLDIRCYFTRKHVM